jgi:hypothetical protein
MELSLREAEMAQAVLRAATGWTTEVSEFDPGRVKTILLSMSSRLAVGSIQFPIQLVPEALSRG